MFRKMLTRSLWLRRNRVVVALLALVAVATLASALGSLWQGSISQARGELRKYGANLLVLPKDMTWLSQIGLQGQGRGPELDNQQMKGVSAVLAGTPGVTMVPSFFSVVTAKGRTMVAQGTDLAALRSLNPWWQVKGSWPEREAARWQALVGRDVAEALGLEPGASLYLQFEGRNTLFTVAGILSSGTSEDSQVILDLDAARSFIGREGLDLIQFNIKADKISLQKLTQDMEAQNPGVEARVVGQMVEAESQVLGKVHALLAWVALAVAVTAAIAVFSTMAASVLERTPEIGLMRALGATGRYIGGLFVAESLALALVGGLVGYPLGIGLAQIVAWSVFGSAVALSPVALPSSLAAAIAVSLAASVLPVQRALKTQPGLAMRYD